MDVCSTSESWLSDEPVIPIFAAYFRLRVSLKDFSRPDLGQKFFPEPITTDRQTNEIFHLDS